jgi:xanthosine utilization system XapX-like protein
VSRSLERSRPADKRGRRAQIIVQAVVFTPLAAVMVAGVVLALVKIASGETGYVVLLFVSGVLAIVLGYQAYHYVRDLGAEPVVTEGEVAKKWTKGNLFFFFMPSYYIAVKGKIYTVTRLQFRGLLEEDLVRIRHYPHTLTVEYIERFDEVEKRFVPAEPDAGAY